MQSLSLLQQPFVNLRPNNAPAGLPKGSPTTSPYFSNEAHKHDQYSIAFSFLPKQTVSGDALVFGNDFDHPVRDRLPPGFNTALKIVKWAIDPGLDGDVYADKPHLYGPALSSLNVVRVGEKVASKGEGDGGWKIPVTVHEDEIQEGGDGDGVEMRKEKGMPEEADKRKKYYLDEKKRKDFEFEEGRVYQADFFNPYLDFNGTIPSPTTLPLSLQYGWLLNNNVTEFSLKLPGFSLSILGYLDNKDSLRYLPPPSLFSPTPSFFLSPICFSSPDSQKQSHTLSYVLKNRDTGDVFFVVVFTLVPKGDVEKEEGLLAPKGEGDGKGGKAYEPADDDVD